MVSRRILPDVVTLYNFAGEVNDEAKYYKTIISFVNMTEKSETDLNSKGKESGDSSKLYIFDEHSQAETETGLEKKYITYHEWESLSFVEKEKHWTINDSGCDFFVRGIHSETTPHELKEAFRIVGFRKLQAGCKRIWHIEVDGR